MPHKVYTLNKTNLSYKKLILSMSRRHTTLPSKTKIYYVAGSKGLLARGRFTPPKWRVPKTILPIPIFPSPFFLPYPLKPSEFGNVLMILSEFSAKRHIKRCACGIFSKNPFTFVKNPLGCVTTQFWKVNTPRHNYLNTWTLCLRALD